MTCSGELYHFNEMADPLLSPKQESRAISQGGPRDAAVNFDTYRIYNGIVQFLCDSTAFLLVSV